MTAIENRTANPNADRKPKQDVKAGAQRRTRQRRSDRRNQPGPKSISEIIAETLLLLAEHGRHATSTAGPRFTTVVDLTESLNYGPESGLALNQTLPETLSPPL